MANGSGTGRVTAPGIVFGGMLVILIVISVWLFMKEQWWFTPLASVHGAAVDRVFMAVLIVSAIAFILVQALLALLVARYGANGKDRASYWHDNPKAEAILIGITAVTLTVLVFMGQRVWADIYFSDPPENAILVEVTGQQFQWVFRYPGDDGVFGRLDPGLVNAATGNFIGLDRSDPAAVDDIMTLNQLHFVQNRPARVRIRSTDVIHNFHLPNLRVKQDAVPGMTIETWFTPTQAGTFEIACAELCGANHYRMKAMVTVDATEAGFQQFLEEQRAFQ